jgi:hypothetical protein
MQKILRKSHFITYEKKNSEIVFHYICEKYCENIVSGHLRKILRQLGFRRLGLCPAQVSLLAARCRRQGPILQSVVSASICGQKST